MWAWRRVAPLVAVFGSLVVVTGTAVAQGASLTARPSPVRAGQPVTAAWSGLPPTGSHRIRLHRAAAPNGEYVAERTATGASGSVQFVAPSAPGEYQFRLYRDGARIVSSAAFQVTPVAAPTPTPTATSTVAATPTTVAAPAPTATPAPPTATPARAATPTLAAVLLPTPGTGSGTATPAPATPAPPIVGPGTPVPPTAAASTPAPPAPSTPGGPTSAPLTATPGSGQPAAATNTPAAGGQATVQPPHTATPAGAPGPAAPGAPTTGPGVGSALEGVFNYLIRPGRVLYHGPTDMTQGEPGTVIVRIARNEDVDVAKDVGPGGQTTVSAVEVAEEMRVRLDGGEDFKVRDVHSDPTHFVPITTFSEWTWEVTPLKSGELDLRIVVEVIVRRRDGNERSITPLPVDRKTITVSVNPVWSVGEFVKSYWQWLATTLIVPFALWAKKAFFSGADEAKKDDPKKKRQKRSRGPR